MSRSRVSPGEKTKPEQYRVGDGSQKKFNAISKARKEPKAELTRAIMIPWIDREYKKLVAAKAKKGAKKSFPIRKAAAKKKKRR